MFALPFNQGQKRVNYCISDFHSRVFLLVPYPLCLTYFVLSVWKKATERKFNQSFSVPTAVNGCLTEIVCLHRGIVTEDIFTQKEANMNDRISPVKLNCSMHFWGNVTGKNKKHWFAVVELVQNLVAHGDAREGKWRGNWRMEWVASNLTPTPNVAYPALLKLMCTPRLPAVDWTDAPTDLNGLVRFGERRNLVSARVPSGSARALPHT